MPPEYDNDRLRKRFEVLADALAAPGSEPQPDNLLPVNAPEWLWEAWEAHELIWQGIELTIAQIRALPDTKPGQCPEEEEEFVWTSEEIAKDRDFEALGWDHDEDGAE